MILIVFLEVTFWKNLRSLLPLLKIYKFRNQRSNRKRKYDKLVLIL
jgi:hypothetical protein